MLEEDNPIVAMNKMNEIWLQGEKVNQLTWSINYACTGA